MNSFELNKALTDAASDLRDALAELETQTRAYAEKERDYRRAKATAYLATSGTVAEREAHAENAVNQARYERDLSDGLRTSALEAVRSRRGILSAIQTLTNMVREEAAFARTGPQEGP